MKTQQTVIICVTLFLSVVAIVVGDVLIQRNIAMHGAQPDAEAGKNIASTPAERRHFGAETSAFVPGVQRQAGPAHFQPNNAWNRPEERGNIAPTRVASHTNSYQSRSAALTQFQNTLAGLRLAQDVVLNNIANAGTTGFKRSRIRFADLAYKQVALPGASDAQGHLSPIGMAAGRGSRVAGTEVDHSEGCLQQTGNTFDIAIVGDGFFQIQGNSETLFSRAGNFTKNSEGQLVLASADRGRLLEPNITVPPDAVDVIITSDGTVSVRQAGSETLNQIGTIQTVRFVNPQGLIQLGNNLYGLTDASGQPLTGIPGTDGRGEVRSGFLEVSNTNLEAEMFELRRLESRRRAVFFAMKLLMPAMPGISELGTSPTARDLLAPGVAVD
ncbi:MAG: flagellar hook-basal body complex protein, partial [Planctomycetaceae bacterium]|nr:flagellar hook-basal body complex protein [Planctomycetaceae bacterium]